MMSLVQIRRQDCRGHTALTWRSKASKEWCMGS